MGAAAVVAMAESALPAAEPATRRPLHPFFAGNRNPEPVSNETQAESKPQVDCATDIRPSDLASDDGKQEDENAEHPGSVPKKRRQMNHDSNGDEESKKPRSKKARTTAGSGGIAHHFTKLGSRSNGEHNETGAVRIPGVEDADQSATTAPDAQEQEDIKADLNAASRPNETSSNNQPNNTDAAKNMTAGRPPSSDSSLAKPKTFMQFNPKTGTIGPPPKPKEAKSTGVGDVMEGEKKPAGRRGRKPASKVVVISYGTDQESRTELGDRINEILNRSQNPVTDLKQMPLTPTKKKPSRRASKSPKRSPKATKQAPKSESSTSSAKTTHPFFLGKVRKQEPAGGEVKTSQLASPSKASKNKVFSSTPCSPKKLRLGPSSNIPLPQFGVKNTGLKFPGAKLPAWPCLGMVHVRGEEAESVNSRDEAVKVDPENLPSPLVSRKSKGHSVTVLCGESIIGRLTQSLEIPAVAENIRNIDTDKVIPPPPELRLPQKHFESGSKLQARIKSQLKTFQASVQGSKSAETKSSSCGDHGNVNPPRQLARLFDSVRSSLSAFDRSQCETANWVHKYAPSSATEILQPGREAFLLRDWLKALMVQSVDTGSTETEKPKKGSKAKGAKNKRRKKLDGFIVSSDDEDYELNELSEDEAEWAPSGSRGIMRKTVLRPGGLSKDREGDKLANTLVISGPHGCGKTAAVYAAANELGFEVFEINSCSRRSGKDIVAKIGNMTKNHHVNQHQSTNAVDGQVPAADDETAKDIKSGKQATMGAFFKLKSTAPKPEKPATVEEDQQPKEVKKDSPKNQRQSLILLEEADILYAEDKQFWTTVVELIAESKRPFVVTCNDETLIPLHTLRLHGIFRLDLPPRDLAIDRLLLIAANEGHVLTRHAVETLYDSRNSDLRAATMDLQYWCQIGVGDRRGGFDWFYPRWPKGIDLDENKEVVRVISENTYIAGMNLLARDRIAGANLSPRMVEDELMYQTWESWGLDIGNWADSTGLQTWAQDLEPAITTPTSRLAALEAFSDASDAMSAADACSFKSFAAFKEEALDVTQPEPPLKTQDDFLVGLNYIDTTSIVYYDSLATDIPCAMKSLAKSCLQEYTNTAQKGAANQLRPLNETQTIDYLQRSFTSPLPGTMAIGRIDFALAFDPIAIDSPSLQPSAWLDPSIFDRTLELIVLDVAPFVRGIVAYDTHLQKQRLKMSNLMSEGGLAKSGTKRMRTTRAALSALEGGARSTTRSEKWFKADINPYLVAKTAGKGWSGPEAEELDPPSPQASSIVSSADTTSPEASPGKAPMKKAAGRRGRPRIKVVIDEDADADEP